ncbi:MAG: hypothetical protein NTW78_03915 [Campylobacterales bacterium]|nr:hypothetical protein [Campylobacterales bacterium]
MKENSFIENVNHLSDNFSVIEASSKYFTPNVLPILQEIASLDLRMVTDDFLKGNFFGNRKIDIDLAANKTGVIGATDALLVWNTTSNTVYYNKVLATFVDGVHIEILFTNDDNQPINISTAGDLVLQLYKHVAFTDKMVNTSITNDVGGLIGSIVRVSDIVGTSSNIERLQLFNVAGASPVELNPSYYWARTTSSLQTLAMRASDIIEIGTNINDIVVLSQKINELLAIKNEITKLLVVYDNLNEVDAVAGSIDTVNTVNTNMTKLQNLDTNMTKIAAVDTNMAKIATVSGSINAVNTVNTNIAKIQNLDTNMVLLTDLHTNITAILDAHTQALTSAISAQASANSAQSSASSATQSANSAQSAASSAQTATNKSNEIKGITAQAQTLIAGQNVTVSYNPIDGKFTFGIPQGNKGDKGDNFNVNSVGLFAQRSLYNAQLRGFSFLALDSSTIYFKLSDTSGDWSLGSLFGKGEIGDTGATGNGIANITFLSTTHISGFAAHSGGVDTYKITFTDTTTSNFNVYNGLDSQVATVAGRVGDIVLTKSDVNLSNVDNTSDINKPVSIAQQAALDLKADKSTTYTKTESDASLLTLNSKIYFIGGM